MYRGNASFKIEFGLVIFIQKTRFHRSSLSIVLLPVHQEEYAKAEKLFVDVMQRQISQKGVAQDDNSIIAMSLKLATIFTKTEQHEKAEQGFEFCIDTTEKKLKAGKN